MPRTHAATVVVKQDEEKPVSREVLADAIVKLADAAAALQKGSGLNRRAIVVLLHDASGVGKLEIRAVLDAMEDLKKNFCR